jgi:hypothetical protein
MRSRQPLILRTGPDQSLKTRVAAQRIPDRIEFENRNCDSVGRMQRAFENVQRLVRFTGQGVNLGKRDSDTWAIKSIFRLRCQLNRMLALCNGFFLAILAYQNESEFQVTSRVTRTFA